MIYIAEFHRDPDTGELLSFTLTDDGNGRYRIVDEKRDEEMGELLGWEIADTLNGETFLLPTLEGLLAAFMEGERFQLAVQRIAREELGLP